MNIASFVKERRKELRLTQPELAMRAGVGLRFVRELEQGKKTLRLDKVNQVIGSLRCRSRGRNSCREMKQVVSVTYLATVD
ncbi:transcriptional regulator, y4mF family [Capnocytophaga sp. oral taxon 326 str. F0382]|nr:helix-turn-helix transcriptional regulator [Capnocytophaga sp. oral taxon 326]EKY15215.1 transcriptional regulator, y4mF family [Capnocytophaga sp. oral taxon 326 str. F0382]